MCMHMYNSVLFWLTVWYGRIKYTITQDSKSITIMNCSDNHFFNFQENAHIGIKVHNSGLYHETTCSMFH